MNVIKDQKLTIKIVAVIALMFLILVGSKIIDVLIGDWKITRMCKEVYSKAGEAEVEACLQREADRQVRNER